MLGKICIIFLLIVIVRAVYYIQNFIFLLNTNKMIHEGKSVEGRLIHLRDIAEKGNLLMNIGVLMNIGSENYLTEISRVTIVLLGETKRKIIETINPIYWIMTIVFLPTKIIEYFGGDSQKLSTKILNFIYWLIPIIATIFSEEIKLLILSWIEKI